MGSQVDQVAAVLQSLWEVGLTANLAKCYMGKTETTCLRYTLRNGQIQPLVDKVQALQRFPKLNIKTHIHQFLGLDWYYLVYTDILFN